MNLSPADSATPSVAISAAPSLVLAHDSAINYAFQQNAIPVVKELRFQNDGVARKDLVIRVTTEPAFAAPAEIAGKASRRKRTAKRLELPSLSIRRNEAMNQDSDKQPPPGGQFLVYQTADGKLKIDVRFEGETVWLTQQHTTELFQTTKQDIGQHLKSIFAEGELPRDSVVKEFFTTEPAFEDEASPRASSHKEFLSVRQVCGNN